MSDEYNRWVSRFPVRDPSDPRDAHITELTAKVRNLENAVKDAAASTVKAIDRLQLMNPIVEAARRRYVALERVTAGDLAADRDLKRAEAELKAFVESYNTLADAIAKVRC